MDRFISSCAAARSRAAGSSPCCCPFWPGWDEEEEGSEGRKPGGSWKLDMAMSPLLLEWDSGLGAWDNLEIPGDGKIPKYPAG